MALDGIAPVGGSLNSVTGKGRNYIQTKAYEEAQKTKDMTEENKLKFKELQESMEVLKGQMSIENIQSAQDFIDKASEFMSIVGNPVYSGSA